MAKCFEWNFWKEYSTYFIYLDVLSKECMKRFVKIHNFLV